VPALLPRKSLYELLVNEPLSIAFCCQKKRSTMDERIPRAEKTGFSSVSPVCEFVYHSCMRSCINHTSRGCGYFSTYDSVNARSLLGGKRSIVTASVLTLSQVEWSSSKDTDHVMMMYNILRP